MNPRLRVLHVLGELKPSGAETMLVAAARLFREAGVELHVLSTGATPGPFAPRFEQAGYRVHHLPFRRSPKFFLGVRALLLEQQLDVIHLHTEGANFWFGLVALSTGVPVVLRTVHNAFPFEGALRWRRGLQRRLLQRLGLRHVSIGQTVRQNEERRFALATTMVWNWYDSERFMPTDGETQSAARAALGIGEKEFVFACVGNCSKIKNHEALIEAIARLPTDKRPLLLHAGIEEPQAPERVLSRQLGIEGHIRFLGGVPNVLPILQAADAFVMPSRYEGFGIAAVEALATGLPAVFTDVPGLRDFREFFPSLVYVEPDAESIAAGLSTLMRMPREQREAIREEYPRIARQHFGMERGVREYLALYRGSNPAPGMAFEKPTHRAAP